MDVLRGALSSQRSPQADALGSRTSTPQGGLLFLSVPVGPDVVAWNLHRRYGHVRLPLLLDGWGLARTGGRAADERLASVAERGVVAWRRAVLDDTSVHFSRSYEPVLVLAPLPLPSEVGQAADSLPVDGGNAGSDHSRGKSALQRSGNADPSSEAVQTAVVSSRGELSVVEGLGAFSQLLQFDAG